MSLSIEEAVYEGVTAVLGAYEDKVPVKVLVDSALEALEDFVAAATDSQMDLHDVMEA